MEEGAWVRTLSQATFGQKAFLRAAPHESLEGHGDATADLRESTGAGCQEKPSSWLCFLRKKCQEKKSNRRTLIKCLENVPRWRSLSLYD